MLYQHTGPAPTSEAVRVDDAAWHDEVMRRYWAPLHGWAKNKVAVTADAEDIAQAAMTIAWANRDLVRHRDYDTLWPWLLAVARNLLRNYHARQLARHRWSYLVTFDDDLPVPAEPGWGEAGLLARAEAEHLLSLLTPCHAQVLRLTYLHGHNTHETAALLGMNPDTVDKTRSRALRAARPHAITLGLGRERVPSPPADGAT